MGAFFADHDLPVGLVEVFDRSGVSLSIADYTTEDCPLIGVNSSFCELSGYDPEEVLGRNCRFLQPPEGAGPVRKRMRDYLADDRAVDAKFLIPNQRRDGTPFLNLVYMSKLTRNGQVIAVLGSQFAVTKAIQTDAALYERALAEDLRHLKLTMDERNMALLGSFEALASGHSIVAQSKLE